MKFNEKFAIIDRLEVQKLAFKGIVNPFSAYDKIICSLDYARSNMHGLISIKLQPIIG